MTTKWDKFKLLMWKNFLLQWRHKIQTLFEIAIPVLFSALLVLIRSLVTPDIFPESMTYNPLPLTSFLDIISMPEVRDMIKIMRFVKSNRNLAPLEKIYYSPDNPILAQLMSIVRKTTAPIFSLVAWNSSAVLENALTRDNPMVGVEFPDAYVDITELPQHLDYALRYPGELRGRPGNPLWFNWRTDFRFPVFQPGGARNFNITDGGYPPGYYRESFLHVQHSIFRAFATMQATQNSFNIKEVPDFMIRRFPYPPFVFDILLQGLQTLVSAFILLSFVYPCINIVKYITTEKEKQLKEAMKIMGLPSWLHWTAWFLKCFIYMFITIILMVTLLKVQWYANKPVSVFTYSDFSVLGVFLLIYAITTIMFCFMLSVFFSKANTAAAVAGLVWFLFYSPFTVIRQRYDQISLPIKLLMCLLHNTGMALGFDVIIRFEGTQEGFQWDNLFKSVTVDDNLTIGYIWIMLIIDAILYLLIALYVEKIFPGDYGVPEPWYFPFTKKFWMGPEKNLISDSVANGVESNGTINFEKDPKNKIAGIQIKNLKKTYSNKKTAVKGLNLNMYEDQITVLLGHNGAGKTTTMSMLTGMISPTSGTAIVNGKDIRLNIDAVRESIGLCPQHNILFDELTVREHIDFFGRLKGLHKDEIDKEVQKYVRLLKLEDKIDCPAGALSGGMKRKLSVGIALCADSKVVLCDEPTSGMDPAARRALWDLIQHEKYGRTILLSTHFMDEADVLGDRIAIMANGDLKAVGTSFFLKKRFGVGYHLVCVKKDGCDSGNITKLLKKYIPELESGTDIGSELSYLLDESHVSVFQHMLEDLENESENLNISSYGISLTTMEEVFLKVGSDNQSSDSLDETMNGGPSTNGHVSNGNISTIIVQEKPATNGGVKAKESHDVEMLNNPYYTYSEKLDLLQGPRLYLNQFRALMEKKVLNTYRNFVLFLIQILIPVSFISITITMVSTWGGNTDLPKMALSVNTYYPTVTSIQVRENMTDLQSQIFENYKSQFVKTSKHLNFDVTSVDMNTHYLSKAKQFQARVNARYLFGVSFEERKIVTWFSNQPYHAAPITLLLAENAVLKTICENCSISMANRPLPYRAESRLAMLQAGNNLGFQLAFNIGFACAFVSAFFIIFYIKERVTKAKLLQFVSGVNVVMYWLTAFIWDFLQHIFISVLMVLTIGAFQQDGFATVEELTRTFIVLVCFGFAAIPVVYVSAFFFSAAATGFTRMSIIFIFLGVAMYTVVFSMKFEGFNLRHVAETLTWIFLTVPQFALSQAFSSLNLINIAIQVCDRQCAQMGICDKELLCKAVPQCCNTNYFSWEEPGILRNLVYFVGVGVGTMIILLLIEFRLFEVIYYKLRNYFRCIKRLGIPDCCQRTDSQSKELVSEDIDVDVAFEKGRIDNLTSSEIATYNLVMRNVTRFYGNFLAVNKLSTAINPSECFGLLGINGAGKTSTFKMLTGDIKISGGEAWVQGISLKSNMKKVHERIGYCPQFDALIEELTGRETLRLFALCRGIPNNKLNDVISKLSGDFNFKKHLDKQVRAYSGGNKRKLSTAVALLGNPVIVYLDEPTTGMDPGAKRNLWDVMCDVRDSGKTIVLTSHSMEECEALCTRLAIMVNGEFKCLGSTQHLKNKFAQGFTLTIKLKRKPPVDGIISRSESEEMLVDKDRSKSFIVEHFQGAILKEEYFDMLTYTIPALNIKWSQIFGILEGAKKLLGIEDYSIGQTSLEQIFLSFTKQQRNSED